MKSLVIVIAVILAVILAMGGLSSLSGSLSDVIATTTAAVTTEGMIDSPEASGSDVIFYPYSAGRIPNLVFHSVCYYVPGAGYYSYDENVSLIWGFDTNTATDEAMLAFKISGLTVGNEYLLTFDSCDNTLQYFLCYRFATKGSYFAIDMDSFAETFTIRFKATTSTFTMGLVKFSNVSDIPEENFTALLKSKLAVLKDTLSFELCEVIS